MLRQKKHSAIIHTASFVGLMALPGLAPYTLTKHALVGLVKTLKQECSGTPITVHLLCPGLIHTGIVNQVHGLNGRSVLIQKVQKLYAQYGTHPKFVAKDAMRGVNKGHFYIITPFWHWRLARALMFLLKPVYGPCIKQLHTFYNKNKLQVH